jgi:hypothetical protein
VEEKKKMEALLRIFSIIALALLAGAVSANPAASQTILSQIQYCDKNTDAAGPPNVACRFNVLIIDPPRDRRLSCDFAMVLHYQRRNSPPFPRLVSPMIDTSTTALNCFVQPGLGIPHTQITDISTRTSGDHKTNLSTNAYMLYSADKITFCMNAGTLYGIASETVCSDAVITPF